MVLPLTRPAGNGGMGRTMLTFWGCCLRRRHLPPHQVPQWCPPRAATRAREPSTRYRIAFWWREKPYHWKREIFILLSTLKTTNWWKEKYRGVWKHWVTLSKSAFVTDIYFLSPIQGLTLRAACGSTAVDGWGHRQALETQFLPRLTFPVCKLEIKTRNFTPALNSGLLKFHEDQPLSVQYYCDCNGFLTKLQERPFSQVF